MGFLLNSWAPARVCSLLVLLIFVPLILMLPRSADRLQHTRQNADDCDETQSRSLDPEMEPFGDDYAPALQGSDHSLQTVFLQDLRLLLSFLFGFLLTHFVSVSIGPAPPSGRLSSGERGEHGGESRRYLSQQARGGAASAAGAGGFSALFDRRFKLYCYAM